MKKFIFLIFIILSNNSFGKVINFTCSEQNENSTGRVQGFTVKFDENKNKISFNGSTFDTNVDNGVIYFKQILGNLVFNYSIDRNSGLMLMKDKSGEVVNKLTCTNFK
jgi:hypothetical protein